MILEHEILKCLYNFSGFEASNGTQAKGFVPLYKRTYEHCYIHFGTLVDLLNSPANYTKHKLPKNTLFYIQNLVRTKEQIINLEKYNYYAVADAIEMLVLNKHIKEDRPVVFDDVNSRRFFLLEKGAIDFRNKFYVKEYNKNEIETLNLKEKKYGFWFDLLKGAIGGIIGAIITLLSTKLINSPQPPPSKPPAAIIKTVLTHK